MITFIFGLLYCILLTVCATVSYRHGVIFGVTSVTDYLEKNNYVKIDKDGNLEKVEK
jgi:hypothetical protein